MDKARFHHREYSLRDVPCYLRHGSHLWYQLGTLMGTRHLGDSNAHHHSQHSPFRQISDQQGKDRYIYQLMCRCRMSQEGKVCSLLFPQGRTRQHRKRYNQSMLQPQQMFLMFQLGKGIGLQTWFLKGRNILSNKEFQGSQRPRRSFLVNRLYRSSPQLFLMLQLCQYQICSQEDKDTCRWRQDFHPQNCTSNPVGILFMWQWWIHQCKYSQNRTFGNLCCPHLRLKQSQSTTPMYTCLEQAQGVVHLYRRRSQHIPKYLY